MAKSSVNFQRVSVHAFRHNSREEKRTAATVFPEHSHLNQCSLPAADAKELFDNLYKYAISKVTGRTRRAKKENTLVEAVVNLQSHHTLYDAQKVARKIEEITGFTAIQIAIHKDEGKEKDGILVRKNHHAHITFFTLCPETGRQMFRRQHLTPKKLSKIQDIVAEELGMERGERGSKRKRLGHREYKAMAKRIEEMKYQYREVQRRITALQIEAEEKKALHAENVRLNRLLKSKAATIEEKEEEKRKLLAKIEELEREAASRLDEAIRRILTEVAVCSFLIARQFTIVEELIKMGWNAHQSENAIIYKSEDGQSYVADLGQRIVGEGEDKMKLARAMLEIAKKSGMRNVEVSGGEAFVAAAKQVAKELGINVVTPRGVYKAHTNERKRAQEAEEERKRLEGRYRVLEEEIEALRAKLGDPRIGSLEDLIDNTREKEITNPADLARKQGKKGEEGLYRYPRPGTTPTRHR